LNAYPETSEKENKINFMVFSGLFFPTYKYQLNIACQSNQSEGETTPQHGNYVEKCTVPTVQRFCSTFLQFCSKTICRSFSSVTLISVEVCFLS